MFYLVENKDDKKRTRRVADLQSKIKYLRWEES